jgi:uncharacterized protein YbjT (DUF2867 family)
MILVTGATGTNGLMTIREFAQEKDPVRALVRNAQKASKAGLDKFAGEEIVEGDMSNPKGLKAALDQADRVLMISSASPDMLETQCSFIDACKEAGVSHVVKFSGAESGIGFDPTKFRFTKMHEEVEDYLESSGLAWTHLRSSQFMQVYLREAPTIGAQGAICLPFEDIELSPVAIEDIAKIAHRLLRDGGHEGESLDITGPEALTMDGVAKRISMAIGRTVKYVRISAEERRRALLASGVPAGFADALDEQLEERRKHPKSRVYLGTHEAFGVRPTTFAEFAEKYATVFAGQQR